MNKENGMGGSVMSTDNQSAQSALVLRDWLRERGANARRLAALKTGQDRAGWLEDAAYFDAAALAVSRATPPTPEQAGPSGEALTDSSTRHEVLAEGLRLLALHPGVAQAGGRKLLESAAAALASPGAMEGAPTVPPEVTAWCEARKAHAAATEAYNARARYARERDEVDGFGATPVDAEFYAMTDTGNALHAALKGMLQPLFDWLEGGAMEGAQAAQQEPVAWGRKGYDSLRTALAAERARADAAERDARRWRELLQETLARLDAATEGVQHGSQKA